MQDRNLTQQAIDRRQTLIAFEAMNRWGADGSFKLHVFHKNNEVAGYSSVLHALEIVGSTGTYSRNLCAAVIGFGATARGAVTALNALGIRDIDVLTNRDISAVASPIHSARMVHFDHDVYSTTSPRLSHAITEDGVVPLAGFLAEHDIIVNCVLQDTDAPLTFLAEKDLIDFPAGSLIIDVSCDEAMGFDWARPTTFDNPTFIVGDNITYYAVDHSPSYLWNSATWEISEALLPIWSRCLRVPVHGRTTRPFAGPSRSSMARCAIRVSCHSRTDCPITHICNVKPKVGKPSSVQGVERISTSGQTRRMRKEPMVTATTTPLTL